MSLTKWLNVISVSVIAFNDHQWLVELSSNTDVGVKLTIPKNTVFRKRSSSQLVTCIFVMFIVIFGISSTTCRAATPPGPRATTSQERLFFNNLMVPTAMPILLSGLLFAETDDQILGAVGNSTNNAGQHCCGVGDCRYVKSLENPDGTYVVFLGDSFPNSKSRKLLIPRSKLSQGRDVSQFTPQSSVLCASPQIADLADPNFVYCFRPAQNLTDNNRGQWLQFVQRQEVSSNSMRPPNNAQ